jgi:hypothetical protein
VERAVLVEEPLVAEEALVAEEPVLFRLLGMRLLPPVALRLLLPQLLLGALLLKPLPME